MLPPRNKLPATPSWQNCKAGNTISALAILLLVALAVAAVALNGSEPQVCLQASPAYCSASSAARATKDPTGPNSQSLLSSPAPAPLQPTQRDQRTLAEDPLHILIFEVTIHTAWHWKSTTFAAVRRSVWMCLLSLIIWKLHGHGHEVPHVYEPLATARVTHGTIQQSTKAHARWPLAGQGGSMWSLICEICISPSASVMQRLCHYHVHAAALTTAYCMMRRMPEMQPWSMQRAAAMKAAAAPAAAAAAAASAAAARTVCCAAWPANAFAALSTHCKVGGSQRSVDRPHAHALQHDKLLIRHPGDMVWTLKLTTPCSCVPGWLQVWSAGSQAVTLSASRGAAGGPCT